MSLDRLSTGSMVASYNGYTFGPTAFTSAFSVRPRPDPAGRTVTHADYTITVTETIQDATTTDPVVQDAIARLTRNGGELRYKGRGFGDLELNTGSGKRDVKWGPWTREISCKPTGAGRAVELTWTVEISTVNCPDGLTTPGTILAFTFTVGVDIDSEGYSARNYEATLTIAQTRKGVGDKTLSATADAHLEKMIPAIPTEFRRESRSSRLSADKCELRVSIRDTQMPPHAPPIGIIDAKVEHTYQSQGLFRWGGVLSADYTLARGGNATFAIAAFEALIRDRRAKAELMTVGAGLPARALAGGPLAGRVGSKAETIPVAASASETDIYGRTHVRLSVTYTVAGVGFGEIFANSGLWTRPPVGAGGEWKYWVASAGVADAMGPRGHARLTFKPNEDALVDACIPGASAVVPRSQAPAGAPGVGSVLFGAASAILTGALSAALANAFPPPRAEQSWLHYDCRAVTHLDTGRVVGTTLPSQPLSASSGQQRAANFDVFARGSGGQTQSQSSAFPALQDFLSLTSNVAGETFVQQRTRPRLYLTVSGQALRAGYPVPVPEVTTINDRRPTLVGQPYFAQMVVANAGVPIVRADWSMTYVFEDDGRTAGAIPLPSAGPFA